MVPRRVYVLGKNMGEKTYRPAPNIIEYATSVYADVAMQSETSQAGIAGTRMLLRANAAVVSLRASSNISVPVIS